MFFAVSDQGSFPAILRWSELHQPSMRSCTFRPGLFLRTPLPKREAGRPITATIPARRDQWLPRATLRASWRRGFSQEPVESHRQFPSDGHLRHRLAAAVGGVTTVVEHTHSHPVLTVENLREKAAHLADRSVVDFGLAAHVFPPTIENLPA